jgi:hypothetical protein
MTQTFWNPQNQIAMDEKYAYVMKALDLSPQRVAANVTNY